MRFANPAGLALAALAIPVIVLHILRPRRTAQSVSSLFLWRSLERPVSSARPWQKLRWSALLLAQLLAVAVLAVAVARPVRLGPAKLAAHTVFIIDASASMGAIDGSPDRMSDAIAQAESLRGDLPEDGVASVVLAGPRPRVLLTASPDPDAFDAALRTIDVGEGRADFAGAFALAESLETGAQEVGFILLSDGGLTDAEQRQQPPGTVYRRVGTGETNRGVVRLTVEPRGSSLHVRATLGHFGGGPSTQRFRVDVDGVTAHAEQVELKPGTTLDVETDVPLGDRVEAFLEGGDQYPLDDRAVAVAGRRPPIDVLLAGRTTFIGELLAAIPGVTVHVAEPGAPLDTTDIDVAVFAETPVPTDIDVPYLAIAPPAGAPGVAVTGTVDQPAIALVRTTDSSSPGSISRTSEWHRPNATAPDAQVLVGAEEPPAASRVRTLGPVGVPRLSLASSNLPVDVAFPLLGDRILTELTGTAQPTTSLEVGDSLPVPPSNAAVVIDPVGTERSIEAGDSVPVATRAGFWAIRVDGETRLIAVNPPRAESAIAPADEIRKAPTPTGGDGAVPRSEIPLLRWIVALALLVLATEWVLARRRRGVGRRQWRTAAATRIAIAGLLLAAVFAPVIKRPASRLATVFLIDASDSMGTAGTNAAFDWVREALTHRAPDDVAGVVVFGAEARLEQLVQTSSSLGTKHVVVDASATNLEAAMRLGAALVPDDARKRVVLVSDGRSNTGDPELEAGELGELGVPVDVHVIEPRVGADAAVQRIEVPRVVRSGDSVAITASVLSTTGGPATVVLERDGDEVGRRAVELTAGTNEVVFQDVIGADAGGTARYTAFVDAPGDVQGQNDTAYAGVPIEGPASVLVVEGTPDEGATLAGALRASGLAVQTVVATALPDVRELAAYSSIVLVDVDARDLSGEQLQSLETAVRDLGRGLVTVGGERSYGLGGYRGTPLEDLLPVISEITDPMRRTKVAEVLSFDVSGSMANCHCDEGENRNARIAGGVMKTDISKAAAARTVEALSSEDELGILAWNAGAKWIVDLQQLPSAEVVDPGLRTLKPAGNTDLTDSLTDAPMPCGRPTPHSSTSSSSPTGSRRWRSSRRSPTRPVSSTSRTASRCRWRPERALPRRSRTSPSRATAASTRAGISSGAPGDRRGGGDRIPELHQRRHLPSRDHLPHPDHRTTRLIARTARLRRHDGQGHRHDRPSHRTDRDPPRVVAGGPGPGQQLDERRLGRVVAAVGELGRLRRLLVERRHRHLPGRFFDRRRPGDARRRTAPDQRRGRRPLPDGATATARGPVPTGNGSRSSWSGSMGRRSPANSRCRATAPTPSERSSKRAARPCLVLGDRQPQLSRRVPTGPADEWNSAAHLDPLRRPRSGRTCRSSIGRAAGRHPTLRSAGAAAAARRPAVPDRRGPVPALATRRIGPGCGDGPSRRGQVRRPQGPVDPARRSRQRSDPGEIARPAAPRSGQPGSPARRDGRRSVGEEAGAGAGSGRGRRRRVSADAPAPAASTSASGPDGRHSGPGGHLDQHPVPVVGPHQHHSTIPPPAPQHDRLGEGAASLGVGDQRGSGRVPVEFQVGAPRSSRGVARGVPRPPGSSPRPRRARPWRRHPPGPTPSDPVDTRTPTAARAKPAWRSTLAGPTPSRRRGAATRARSTAAPAIGRSNLAQNTPWMRTGSETAATTAWATSPIDTTIAAAQASMAAAAVQGSNGRALPMRSSDRFATPRRPSRRWSPRRVTARPRPTRPASAKLCTEGTAFERLLAAEDGHTPGRRRPRPDGMPSVAGRGGRRPWPTRPRARRSRRGPRPNSRPTPARSTTTTHRAPAPPSTRRAYNVQRRSRADSAGSVGPR
ncbi:MAG: VWA domain-containing protein [Ilumatobacteraceae bacterium]